MTHTDLAGLNVEVKDGVATVTIDNPPLNLLDATPRRSLIAFIDQACDDVQVRVVVFDSADPDFFLAHGDLHFVTDPESFAAVDPGGAARRRRHVGECGRLADDAVDLRDRGSGPRTATGAGRPVRGTVRQRAALADEPLDVPEPTGGCPRSGARPSLRPPIRRAPRRLLAHTPARCGFIAR